MKKILLSSLILAGIGTLMPAFVSANIQGSYKQTVNGSTTQWFFDQVAGGTTLPQNQCQGAWVNRSYYLASDYNSDGIKDFGQPLYLRDNFAVMGGTTPTYLIGVRTNGYGGTVVRYSLPVSNVLRVLNGTATYDLSSQSAWFRLSKTAPKDVWVRAVESEPMLISAPSSNNPAHRNFQVAYQIKYRAFQSSAAGTSDYDVWPVANGGYMGGLSQSNDRWALKTNWAPVPDWQADYQKTTSFINTTAIQWNATEQTHAYECYNVQTHWCGDGVVNNGAFDNTSASEQCDDGNTNNNDSCTNACTTPPIPLTPDVVVQKSVTGSYIQSGLVTYTITFNNIGSGAALNTVVADTLGTGLEFVSSIPNAASVTTLSNGTQKITWNVGTLASMAGGTIKITARIKQSVPNCVTVRNDVRIDASNEPNNVLFNNFDDATFQMQCPSNPNLWIQKDVVASTGGYIPNGYAVYTITFGNAGSGVANNVTVTDVLPPDVSFVSSIPTPSSVAGNSLAWNIGNLNPGQQGTIKIIVKINANVPMCQNYIVLNKGKVQASNANSAEDDAQFLVLCYDLWSTKIIDKPVVASGDVVTYTIRYGNLGPLTAPNWSLVDNMPTGMNYIINSTTILSGVNIGQPVVTGNPTIGQVLTWTGFTNMPAGYSGMVQIKATVLGPVASGHVYVNKICINGDNNYNNNNCADVPTTTTGGNPGFDINIDKKVNKTVVAFGDKVIYTLVITNESDVTAPVGGYTVQDYLPSGVEYFGNPTGPTGMVTTLSGTKDIIFSNLPTLNPGNSITITFEALYKSTVNETNYAEICVYNGVSGTGVKDRDSNPCNRGRNPGQEDDEDQVTIGPEGGPNGQSPECQGMSVVATSPTPNLNISDLTTSIGSIAVQYECRTTWGAYPVDAVLDCGNGSQTFTGTTINGNPFKATCNYSNPTTTRAVCTVARRPNVNCEVPVKIRSGGGGGSNPYCGDGIVRAGEQCDPGNPALGIKPAGVPAGKVCGPDCKYRDQPPGVKAQVKCSYIDPPAINRGEYMPYWWDMEYGYNQLGANGYNDATFSCTSSTGDIRVNKNTLICGFKLRGPGPEYKEKNWEQPCYANPHQTLIDTSFNAAKVRYGIEVYPGGFGSLQITGANDLGLGEYSIEMKVINGKLCNGASIHSVASYDGTRSYDRVCQMNFGVTERYAVSRSTRGTFASKPLNNYTWQDKTPVLKTSELIKALEPFTLSSADKNLVMQMTNKYVNLAVKADTIEDKIDNKTITKAVVSKVPSKNIFVIDAKTPDGKKGTITISDKSAYNGGAFTLIIINGDLVVKGDLEKNANGMFIVRDGDLIFSAESNAQENNQNQSVKGIFIGLGMIKAEGDGQPAFNDNPNKPWVNGGRLLINGIVLGADLSKVVEGRRSIVDNWFDKRAGDGLLDDGAIVIKANPAIFTNLPPGAEDISLTLNVFKN